MVHYRMATAITFDTQSLPDRAVVGLSGDGILSFLHNILTCSIENLDDGAVAYGALLSPQGKILHDMFVHRLGAVAHIDCDAGARDDLVQKLKLYRLRAKFEIVLREDLAVVVGAGVVEPRNALMGRRSIVPAGEYAAGTGYQTHRFALGIADSAEIGVGKLFPHEANFDQFGGVDFKKGCYIGQEVVSRMQHRATARSRIMPVMFENDQPADENAIRAGDTMIGEILGRSGQRGLGLLRLDRLAEAQVPLTAGSQRVRVAKPGWMMAEILIPAVAT